MGVRGRDAGGVAGQVLHRALRGGDVAAVGSAGEGAPPVATWKTYICVESAEEAASKVRQAGGQVLTEPFDVMTAGRMATFMDPEGAEFCVWQPNEHKGREDRQRAGSAELQRPGHPGREGAKSFYGAVFGWQTLKLDGGTELWTLPGYGDHLEQGDPGLRERVTELGAQPGFENVVASINPIPAEEPDVPPHWNVTFAVDDADAIATRARDLGGTVIVPPFDAPWVRMAVIADPAGATFIASQFKPENLDLASGPDMATRAP